MLEQSSSGLIRTTLFDAGAVFQQSDQGLEQSSCCGLIRVNTVLCSFCTTWTIVQLCGKIIGNVWIFAAMVKGDPSF